MKADNLEDADKLLGLINLTYAIGGMVGSILGGVLSTSIGRMRTLRLNQVVIIAAYILHWFDETEWCIYVARILSGICSVISSSTSPKAMKDI